MLKTFYLMFLALLFTAQAEINWAEYSGDMMHVARYSRHTPDYPPNFQNIWADDVIAKITRDSFYGDPKKFDLLKPLGKIEGTTELAKLADFNAKVNKVFSYKSFPLNYWYSEPPIVALVLGVGDCKSYAYYKYWGLRQMGYTNVKLVTVVLPNGLGAIDGHVVVVLNDLWVFDINRPYFYPFEILREETGLESAFFPDGSIWDVQ